MPDAREDRGRMPAEVAVSLIGFVERSHPAGGRYSAFRHHLGLEFVPVALRFRYLRRRLLAAIERRIFRWRDPRAAWNTYALGLFAQEVQVWWAMRRSPGRVFHAVKGERDVHHLPAWSRRTGARLVVTYHDPPSALTDPPPPYFPRHDGIVALCEAQRAFFAARIHPARVRVVHHGVDTTTFFPASAPATSPTVIAVGSYYRDHWTMNLAIERVAAVRPEAEFLIVGTATATEGMELPRVEHPSVRYIDGISDSELVALYHRSSVAIVPVWAATANNALLEAMACGLPVVATDVDGLPEYLGDEAGLLVPKLGIGELADAILRLLGDPDLAARLGRAGRERAVRHFDDAVVAAEMLRFYEDVARWPQAPAPPEDTG